MPSRTRSIAVAAQTEFLQGLRERYDARLTFRLVSAVVHQHADAAHSAGLLRARRERHRSRCTAYDCNELAPLHSITSSAVESSVGGIVTPSAFAVLRLITNSNLVGCSTGS